VFHQSLLDEGQLEGREGGRMPFFGHCRVEEGGGKRQKVEEVGIDDAGRTSGLRWPQKLQCA
jgi:hypothetical protein